MPQSIFEIVQTGDGSHSVYSHKFKATYHSIHGAVTESNHVFINEGLANIQNRKPIISILEIGFGTGLNALLSFQYARQHRLHIRYTSIEKFALPDTLINQLNYPDFLDMVDDRSLFLEMHQKERVVSKSVHFTFSFEKILDDLFEIQTLPTKQDVIYFDAFAPNHQAKIWNPPILKRCFSALASGGILVTYCAQGQFRRDLEAVGFTVERRPGPPGKREMLRASKP